MLATAAWDLGASEPSLPIGWSRGRDELVQEFPWTVANGQLVGRTAGEGQASWQDNSWVETPVFRFIDPGDASIEFDVMHDGFIPGTDTFLDCLIVTLQDAGASDDDSKSSNCASGEQLSVFEHTASQPIDVNVQHEPVNAEANKGYRLRFRASDYDESASNNGFRIGNLRITGIEPDANLVIEVATDRAQITAGVDTLQFDIRVTNFGPIDANNVVVSETLPLGLTITTTHCPQPIGQTCSLSTIASGASVEYSLTASTSRQLPIMVVSQFDVASSASDPVPSNNSAMATVSAISSPNSPPVAVDDTATTDENVVLTIPVSSLLVNDIDPDDELLSLTSLDDSLTRGSVTRVGDELIYDPNGAFVGLAESETVTDTFSYSADDGNGETASATVTVCIPVAGLLCPSSASGSK